MKISVKELRPNPFRHLERYPISREKVEALKQSIKDTEFWDNLLVRKAPDGDGYEMAYGHHRYIALKELRVDEIDVPVRKLDDATMIKIMARENKEEWQWSTTVEQETVRTVIEAFAEGKIELPKTKDGTTRGHVRVAPSFIAIPDHSGRPERSYSAATIATFIGSPESRVEATLNALAVIERGLIKEEDFEGLSAYQAQAVATQVRRVEKETGNPEVAKKVGKELAGGMRSTTGRPGRGGKKESGRQAVTLHGARHVASKAIAKERRETTPKVYPPAGKAIPDLALKFHDIPTATMIQKVELVIAVRKELHVKDIKMLASALRAVAKRVIRLADRLEA